MIPIKDGGQYAILIVMKRVGGDLIMHGTIVPNPVSFFVNRAKHYDFPIGMHTRPVSRTKRGVE